jgi:hypothetical protein
MILLCSSTERKGPSHAVYGGGHGRNGDKFAENARPVTSVVTARSLNPCRAHHLQQFRHDFRLWRLMLDRWSPPSRALSQLPLTRCADSTFGQRPNVLLKLRIGRGIRSACP